MTTITDEIAYLKTFALAPGEPDPVAETYAMPDGGNDDSINGIDVSIADKNRFYHQDQEEL